MYVLLIVVCPFVLFLLVIVLSVLLRHTDSDCPLVSSNSFKMVINFNNGLINQQSNTSLYKFKYSEKVIFQLYSPQFRYHWVPRRTELEISDR